MEHLSAEDLAWANMSYSDRLLWYLDNKILKKSSNTHTTGLVEIPPIVEALGTPVVDSTVKSDVVESETSSASSVVAVVVSEDAIASIESTESTTTTSNVLPAESTMESPKKRSKGKKISIEM